VFWVGQAQELLDTTNFWDAIEQVNDELAGDDLYISHFFTEDQVILTPEWRANRLSIQGGWHKLDIHRLGDADLLLSKLMRDDPIDQNDARFVVGRAGFSREEVAAIVRRARLPESAEVREQFKLASARLLAAIG